MPKKRSDKKGSAISMQMSIRYAKPKGSNLVLPLKILNQAVEYWLENDGEPPPGFEIRPMYFERGQKHYDVIDGSMTEEEFRTLLRRFFRGESGITFTLRDDG